MADCTYCRQGYPTELSGGRRFHWRYDHPRNPRDKVYTPCGMDRQTQPEVSGVLLGDLEYWRKFLLRARIGEKRGMAPPISIDHLTAAALCIGEALKVLKGQDDD